MSETKIIFNQSEELQIYTSNEKIFINGIEIEVPKGSFIPKDTQKELKEFCEKYSSEPSFDEVLERIFLKCNYKGETFQLAIPINPKEAEEVDVIIDFEDLLNPYYLMKFLNSQKDITHLEKEFKKIESFIKEFNYEFDPGDMIDDTYGYCSTRFYHFNFKQEFIDGIIPIIKNYKKESKETLKKYI